jgi:26S proteasome non-ATPase regulatory subunit 9
MVKLQYSFLGLDKSLVDEEGFPRENLDFGELTVYRNLKRTLAGT